jgi:hypothetical protein
MIKERLDLIINELGLSGRAFEKACGLANGSYSSIGNGVGADKLKKILIRFPQISADWLLVGRGEMWTADIAENGEGDVGPRPAESGPDKYVKGSIFARLTDIVYCQQREISHMMAEIEKNGKRADRMLRIIEHERGIDHEI